MIVRHFTVDENNSGSRLDKYLASVNEDYSRNYIQGLIADKQVKVNGKNAKAGYRIKENDRLTITIPPSIEDELIPQNIPLEVIYEDSCLLVINKQAGLVVHPAPGHSDNTLVNALLNKYEDIIAVGNKVRPGIVHRLDRDTSGVMVVARIPSTYDYLVEAFKKREVGKTYLAITKEAPCPIQGQIKSLLGRHPYNRILMAAGIIDGKEALTHYKTLAISGNVALVEVNPVTGRTHQIRVHLASIGSPIIGDNVYGTKQSRKMAQRQMLHSYKIVFRHPQTHALMTFKAPLPDDFNKGLKEYGLNIDGSW